MAGVATVNKLGTTETDRADDHMSDVVYKRSKFSTRLPSDRLYTASHAWLKEDGAGAWHVGFTRFATRILGEPVELDFEVETSAEVQAGQVVGWIEGFKAVTDLFCPLGGRFLGGNDSVAEDISLIHREPYKDGWLYRIAGEPPSECVDVGGYSAILDAAIDKMMGQQS